MKPHYTSMEQLLRAFFGNTPQLREAWQLLRIREAWRALPEPIPQNSLPLECKGGCLTVLASSTVWVQELTMKQHQLLAFLGGRAPGLVPRELRVRLSTRRFPRATPTPTPPPVTKLKPSVGSPAWENLAWVREKASQSEHEWATWFLRVTAPWFDPSSEEDK